jgi:hypothetical protein
MSDQVVSAETERRPLLFALWFRAQVVGLARAVAAVLIIPPVTALSRRNRKSEGTLRR